MRVIYSGVDLMALDTHYFNCESVYDDSGVDYLYTKVSYAGRAMVNGFASVAPTGVGPVMNYGFQSSSPGTLGTGGDTELFSRPPGAIGGAAPGNVITRDKPQTYPPEGSLLRPPRGAGIERRVRSDLRNIIKNPVAATGFNPNDITHQSIRHRLSIPRGKLYIFWGTGMESGTPPAGSEDVPVLGRLFVESPRTDAPCDCKNGPFPRVMSVTNAYGDAMTMLVDWAVETYINEGPENEVIQSEALLSNRFAQSHEVREDGYTAITTQGVAIFRTDSVYFHNISPDSQRSIIFMPILPGFTRKILYVRGREDVTGVEYAYEDTQVSVNFVAGPFVKAASISAVHRQAINSRGDLWGSALQAYERVLGLKANRRFARDDQERAKGRTVVPLPATMTGTPPATPATPIPSPPPLPAPVPPPLPKPAIVVHKSP